MVFRSRCRAQVQHEALLVITPLLGMIARSSLWATVCLSKDVGQELERIGERNHRRKGETKRGNKKVAKGGFKKKTSSHGASVNRPTSLSWYLFQSVRVIVRSFEDGLHADRLPVRSGIVTRKSGGLLISNLLCLSLSPRVRG